MIKIFATGAALAAALLTFDARAAAFHATLECHGGRNVVLYLCDGQGESL
jgi:hypothetical protein